MDLQNLDIVYVAIAIGVIVISLSIHEAAHALAAYKLGDPTAKDMGRLTLNPVPHLDPVGSLLLPGLAAASGLPVIGWAKPVPVDLRNLRNPRRDNVLVAVAGPASNIVLMIFGAFLYVGLEAGVAGGAITGSTEAISQFFLTLATVNGILAVFNMIPLPPLDGSALLVGLLGDRWGWWFEEKIAPYGVFILWILMLAGLLRWVFPATMFMLKPVISLFAALFGLQQN